MSRQGIKAIHTMQMYEGQGKPGYAEDLYWREWVSGEEEWGCEDTLAHSTFFP
jgi:hypothetical protein